MSRASILLSTLALALLTAACKPRNTTPPVYAPLSELAECEDECVAADFRFRHWADSEYYRGRIPYHCDPGSELDGPPDRAVTRMILAIHGVVTPEKLTTPPGLNHVRYIQHSLKQARAHDPSLDPESIAIIGPNFQGTKRWQPYTDEDKRYWTWPGADYKSGADSAENQGFAGAVKADSVSAFEVIDEFLRAGLVKFPNLEQIVVVGNSGGGQTVQRYALLGVGVHEHIEHEGVSVRYMPTNPAFYTFPARRRKLEPGRSTVRPGQGAGDTGNWHWDIPRGCDKYDNYPFGLSRLSKSKYERVRRAGDYAIEHYLRPQDRKLARQARNNPYGSTWEKAARQALILQYASREIWHVQAGTDIEGYLVNECRAQVAGRSRVERFLHFQEVWTELMPVPAPNLHWILLQNPRHHHSAPVAYENEGPIRVLFY